MTPPGNHWYHCMGSTYGSWLRGDSRGWHARHHREHVEGDYKHPPEPGKYDQELVTSRRVMKRPQILLTHAQQILVCQSMAMKLDSWQTPWVDLCVTASHFHLLIQLNPNTSVTAGLGLKQDNRLQDGRNPLPRHVVGRLKKHASHLLRQSGLRSEAGGIWGTRTQIIPIENREHQLSVVRYIRRHADQGGVVWSMLKKTL